MDVFGSYYQSVDIKPKPLRIVLEFSLFLLTASKANATIVISQGGVGFRP